MDFIRVRLGHDDDGRRIDRVLRRFLSDESLSAVYKSIRKGLIKIDGKKFAANDRVHEGSEIQIAAFLAKNSPRRGTENASVPPLDETSVIFRNDSLLLINKPYDIPVQSSSQTSISLTEIIQNDYEKRHETDRSLSFRTGALHRLDRKTTGIIAFSQNLEGAQWFSAQMQAHSLHKSYVAIIQGHLKTQEEWSDTIAKSDTPQTGASFHTVTVNEPSGGKESLTAVSPIAHGTLISSGTAIPITLARFSIKTGRTHQIRSQSAYHGHPLLGDTAYGGEQLDAKRFGQDFFLHAYELQFPRGNPLFIPETLSAPIPNAFKQFVEEYFDGTLINYESPLIM